MLNGTISEKGILAPVTPEFNKSLMVELKEKHGFVLVSLMCLGTPFC